MLQLYLLSLATQSLGIICGRGKVPTASVDHEEGMARDPRFS